MRAPEEKWWGVLNGGLLVLCAVLLGYLAVFIYRDLWFLPVPILMGVFGLGYAGYRLVLPAGHRENVGTPPAQGSDDGSGSGPR